MTREEERLQASSAPDTPWKKWGPYLSERQWGTVREDYSESGDAWGYFSHDQARSRAYRWGEDGLAGISDNQQRLCFALALWNGVDPIIKERLFGLTNSEGNHGEDVKEYYYYLDSTPTHSYMKFLYKYPQSAFPYTDLLATNRSRGKGEPEYELIDTGVFDDDRYFDVYVEYAKATPEDILIRITIANRGPEAAVLSVLPTFWFRNTWSWGAPTGKPTMREEAGWSGSSVVAAEHLELGRRYLLCEGDIPLLFTENETNQERVLGRPNSTPYVKDGINDHVVAGRETVTPHKAGSKAAAYYRLTVERGQHVVIRLRLTDRVPDRTDAADSLFGQSFAKVLADRRQEADEFYASITPKSVGEDAANVMRQALAGMLWTKQYYCFDVDIWLKEHGVDPQLDTRHPIRNRIWFHMKNADIISMPDKWEYPWYAAWDLAFHTIPLAMVDPDFAKHQLDLFLRESYLHPNGQIPAYEWNFSDVNPPVHAWAVLFVYETDRSRHGEGDLEFLEHAFQKLLMNFTWWVNRKDASGSNIFEGGFLGLDNIGVFDRSATLPGGGHLEQSDGTAWMTLYCAIMMQIAAELAAHKPLYQDLATKFFEHFFWIASAMDRIGDRSDALWDEEDGFFYDVLRFPGGDAVRLKVRSLVGLLPLCATAVLEETEVERLPRAAKRADQFLAAHPHVQRNIAPVDVPGVAGRTLFAVVNEQKLRRVLARMLDESEFLGAYGIRSLSRHHLEHPYSLTLGHETFQVSYEPAESTTRMFGGNSNWRGPIWFPMNVLIIRALLNLHAYYGDSFQVECPTGSSQQMTLFEVAKEISHRLIGIFLRDSAGRRAVFGGCEKLQCDPHWRDCLLFYEYFHGDNGAGIGASHQTGWTGMVAGLIAMMASLTSADILAGGRSAMRIRPSKPQ